MIRNVLAIVFCLIALLLAFAAAAHPATTSAILLDVKSDQLIDAEVQLPVDQLVMANAVFVPFAEQGLEAGAQRSTAANVASAELPANMQVLLKDYVASHLSVTLADSRLANVAVGNFAQRQIDGAPYVVGRVAIVAPEGASLQQFA